MKSTSKKTPCASSSLEPIAILNGQGQVPLRHALRISLGRTISDPEYLMHGLIWGVTMGTLNAFFSGPDWRWMIFLSAFMLAMAVSYLSTIPWRIRLHRKNKVPLWRVLLCNGALAILMGYIIEYYLLLGSFVLFKGIDELDMQVWSILSKIALWGFIFPIIGFYIVMGEDTAKREMRMQHRAQWLERKAEEARMVALRAQINPHFFFNTLNTIAALIPTRPADAERAVELLAEALRPALMRTQPMLASLDAELRIVNAYVELEKLRLGDRVVFDYDVDDAALPVEIPSLSLQPLVENAVRHGASRVSVPYRVQLAAKRTELGTEIEIRNAPSETFGQLDAMELTEAPRVEGHALHNIATRLRALFGEDAAFSARVSPGGGIVRMFIPATGAVRVATYSLPVPEPSFDESLSVPNEIPNG